MDTSQLENIAQSQISSQLQQHGLLVAKPYFDLLGTDLLAFANMKDGVKFCRIQSKGRSIKSNNSNITIDKKYVTDGFIVILYLEFNNTKQELYIFFRSDIEQWSLNPQGQYQLSLSPSNVESKLKSNRYDNSKAQLVRSIIDRAEVSGEFNRLIYGTANSRLQSLSSSGTATVTSPNKKS